MSNEPLTTTAEIETVRALGRLIQKKRIAERLTLQQAAEQSKVSAPTLSRIERIANTKTMKGPLPDTRTVTALARWLNLSLEEALHGGPSKPARDNDSAPEGASTPEIVEAHLRADRNLDPRTASMLAEMFKLAYEQYTTLSGSPGAHDADEDTAD